MEQQEHTLTYIIPHQATQIDMKLKYSRSENEVIRANTDHFKSIGGDFIRARQNDLNRLNPHNSLEHEITKVDVAIELMLNCNHTILLEAKFPERTADILDLSDNTIYEIIHTEPKKSIEEKKTYYESLGYDFTSIKSYDLRKLKEE